MKCWGISDTHGMHRRLFIPKGIDTIIHAGDSTNSSNLSHNLVEFEDFFNWLMGLDIKNKIICAGNHDTWAVKAYTRDKLKEVGIIYLENEYAEIEGIKMFGSPWTPLYGNWNFMKDRSKMDDIWKHVDDNVDIWITHGPPAGILDLTENREYRLEQVGDVSLYKRIMEKKPISRKSLLM